MEKIKICIVEDYFLLRSAYKNSLNKIKDFEIIGDFETAEECIEMMKNNQADIILMDLGLPCPYMNGLEATKILSEKYPSAKVIILTSHETEHEFLACAASGASAYVLKDSGDEILIHAIRAVNYGAVWFDPQFAKVAKSAFPKPISTDFENLYPTNEIQTVLTSRELETLKLVSEGKSNVEIAEIMMVSKNTAKAHVGNILSKLSVTDRVQAAVMAVKAHLF